MTAELKREEVESKNFRARMDLKLRRCKDEKMLKVCLVRLQIQIAK